MIMPENFNAHSLKWNFHCNERRDAVGLETQIERHHLILKNDLGKVTRVTHRNTTSIINLTFTSQKIRVLDSWIMDAELGTPFDYQEIV